VPVVEEALRGKWLRTVTVVERLAVTRRYIEQIADVLPAAKAIAEAG
jgi:hypothetical protein